MTAAGYLQISVQPAAFSLVIYKAAPGSFELHTRKENVDFIGLNFTRDTDCGQGQTGTVSLVKPSCGETRKPSRGNESAKSSVRHVSSCLFKDLILIRNAGKEPPSQSCFCASAASHPKWQISIWFVGSG